MWKTAFMWAKDRRFQPFDSSIHTYSWMQGSHSKQVKDAECSQSKQDMTGCFVFPEVPLYPVVSKGVSVANLKKFGWFCKFFGRSWALKYLSNSLAEHLKFGQALIPLTWSWVILSFVRCLLTCPYLMMPQHSGDEDHTSSSSAWYLSGTRNGHLFILGTIWYWKRCNLNEG